MAGFALLCIACHYFVFRLFVLSFFHFTSFIYLNRCFFSFICYLFFEAASRLPDKQPYSFEKMKISGVASRFEVVQFFFISCCVFLLFQVTYFIYLICVFFSFFFYLFFEATSRLPDNQPYSFEKIKNAT